MFQNISLWSLGYFCSGLCSLKEHMGDFISQKHSGHDFIAPLMDEQLPLVASVHQKLPAGHFPFLSQPLWLLLVHSPAAKHGPATQHHLVQLSCDRGFEERVHSTGKAKSILGSLPARKFVLLLATLAPCTQSCIVGSALRTSEVEDSNTFDPASLQHSPP